MYLQPELKAGEAEFEQTEELTQLLNADDAGEASGHFARTYFVVNDS